MAGVVRSVQPTSVTLCPKLVVEGNVASVDNDGM